MVIKPYLTTRNILIAFAVILTMVFLFNIRNKGLAYYEMLKQFDTIKTENVKLKEEVESKQKIIDENYSVIESLNKDRASLAKKIAITRSKRDTIKNPQDTEEIVVRLKSLGLNPQVNK